MRGEGQYLQSRFLKNLETNENGSISAEAIAAIENYKRGNGRGRRSRRGLAESLFKLGLFLVLLEHPQRVLVLAAVFL